MSSEEKKMIELLDAMEHLREKGHHVGAVPFKLPDVICALPIQAVRRAYPQAGREVEWNRIIANWRSTTGPKGGFKSFALKALGLRNVESDDFVHNSLHAVRDGDGCDSELTRAVRGAVAQLVGDRPDL